MSRADACAPRKRWLGWHPVTLGFVVLVGGWLAVSQIQAETPAVSDGEFGPFIAHGGWPFAMVNTVSGFERRPFGLFKRTETSVRAACLAANIVVWGALVGCGAYMCASMIQRRYRFSCLNVFAIVTVASVLLSLHRLAPRLIYPVESAWYMRLPAVLCVAAALSTVIRAAWLCGALMIRRAHRRGTCHD